MMRAAPVIPTFVRAPPLPVAIAAACDGLRALGLYVWAEPIEYAHRHARRRHLESRILEARHAVSAAIAVLSASGAAAGWQDAADRVRLDLRALELRVQRGA